MNRQRHQRQLELLAAVAGLLAAILLAVVVGLPSTSPDQAERREARATEQQRQDQRARQQQQDNPPERLQGIGGVGDEPPDPIPSRASVRPTDLRPLGYPSRAAAARDFIPARFTYQAGARARALRALGAFTDRRAYRELQLAETDPLTPRVTRQRVRCTARLLAADLEPLIVRQPLPGGTWVYATTISRRCTPQVPEEPDSEYLTFTVVVERTPRRRWIVSYWEPRQQQSATTFDTTRLRNG